VFYAGETGVAQILRNHFFLLGEKVVNVGG
jgi:hypothetical protein